MKIKRFLGAYNYVGIRGVIIAFMYKLKKFIGLMFGWRYIKKRIYDFSMYLDLNDDGISHTLIMFGKRELEHRYILQQVLKSDMTVLDIGANIGYYVLIESKYINTGKIIAVEPVPSNIETLKKNLELNKVQNVYTIEGAVSSSSGEKEFHLSNMSNLGTFHPVGTAKKYLAGDTLKVSTCTVRDIAEKYGIPDLLRMDVEGHEVSILNSLIEDIKSCKMAPKILFETHLSRYNEKNNMRSCLNSLFKLGYHVRYAGSSGEVGTKRLKDKGYMELLSIVTDYTKRSVFENIINEDAIDIICNTGGIRTVLLDKMDK